MTRRTAMERIWASEILDPGGFVVGQAPASGEWTLPGAPADVQRPSSGMLAMSVSTASSTAPMTGGAPTSLSVVFLIP